MKIWYDACTGKHVRYGTEIAKRFRNLGHEVLLTTREHPDTLELAKILSEKFVPVGEYNPASLLSRLRQGINRMSKFAEMLGNNVPDVAISHQSVDMCRVAFGLGIPIVLTADTPYAEAVNRLTIPLANVVVTSEAIPKSLFKKYGARRIVQFKGVDEVAWMKNPKPSKVCRFEKPLIVIRQMETRASYGLGRADITERLAKKLASLGNVLFLSRYAGMGKDGLRVNVEFLDSASLVSHADLVVGVGGTIAREAALQGIPSIVVSEFGRTQVNTYLSKKGFPLFMMDTSKVISCARKCLGKKWDTTSSLARMESPVDVIEEIVAEKQYV